MVAIFVVCLQSSGLLLLPEPSSVLSLTAGGFGDKMSLEPEDSVVATGAGVSGTLNSVVCYSHHSFSVANSAVVTTTTAC